MDQKGAVAVGAAVLVTVAGAVAIRQLTAGGPGSSPVPPPAGIGIQVDLPTTSWEPGDDSMAAQGGGILRVDGDDCVYLSGAVRSYAAWPAGYSAFRTDDGELTLYDDGGDAVAQDGDQVELGGGYLHVTSDSEHRCLPEVGGEYFVVNSGVTVVQEGR